MGVIFISTMYTKARRCFSGVQEWPLESRFHNSQILTSIGRFIKFLANYPVYMNLGYLWNFGFALFIVLMLQIVTGFFLSFHYVAYAEVSFNIVEHIMRDINYGWLLRYMHANGASFFFLFVFIHICRALYYKSYTGFRRDAWIVGVILFFLLIVTAFTGYVLPWGQMSFWAATVVTNLFSAIPLIGVITVEWLWGGFAVNNFTLIRIYSLHFILPLIILALSLLHVYFLHNYGGTNNMNAEWVNDGNRFAPYYLVKDTYFLVWLALLFSAVVGFAPNLLLHPDNYIPADPLVTPAHIVPEWYFLIFYAMLRSIPSKLLGVLVLFFSIVILFFLPFFSLNREDIQIPAIPKRRWFDIFSETLNIEKKLLPKEAIVIPVVEGEWRFVLDNLEKFIFWFFFSNCVLLGYIGSQPVEEPFLSCGRIFTYAYFGYFIVIGIISSTKWIIKPLIKI